MSDSKRGPAAGRAAPSDGTGRGGRASGRAAGSRCAAGRRRAVRPGTSSSSTVLRRDGSRVGVVEQVEVVLRQHERRGRLGADDAVALADEVGQAGRCARRPRAAVSTSPSAERGHAAADLPRRDVDLDAVVPKHRDGRLADERIVVAGEDVDEVGDLASDRPVVGSKRGLPPLGFSAPSPMPRAAEEVARARTRAAGDGATRRRASPAASGRAAAPSKALTIGAKLLPSDANPSARASTQSDRVRARVRRGGAAFASSMSLGMLTRASHSSRHILQLTHRSATAFTSSGRRGRRVVRARGAGSPSPAASRPRRPWRGRSGTSAPARPRSGNRRSRCTAPPPRPA